MLFDVMPGRPELAGFADAAAGADDSFGGASDDELLGVMCGWDRVEAHAAARKHAAKCRRDHRLKQHPRWHVPVDHAIRPDLHHHAYRIPGLIAAGIANGG
ncbi:MAG: hypothetical protein ACREOE_15315 [Gemmatimonadales bacterium]